MGMSNHFDAGRLCAAPAAIFSLTLPQQLKGEAAAHKPWRMLLTQG